jgi:hypothetical protein
MPVLRFAGRASTLYDEMTMKMLARSRENEGLACMILKILPESYVPDKKEGRKNEGRKREMEGQVWHPAERKRNGRWRVGQTIRQKDLAL